MNDDIPWRKLLHEPVNFLSLSGQPETLQEVSQRRHNVFVLRDRERLVVERTYRFLGR